MKRRPNYWAPVTGIGLVAVGVFAATPWVRDQMDRAATAEFARELTDSATAVVPVGANGDEAYGWFKSRNMGFASIGRTEVYPWGELHGIPPEKYGGAVVGTKHQTLNTGYNTHRVYFFLGKDGRVIKHVVITSFMDGG
jgi:hypothetical protein